MNDYENLKKKYGERFAKFCRSLFSSLLETQGLLSNIIEEKFEPNKSLYDDIVNEKHEEQFKSYILSCLTKKEEQVTIANETPEQLMAKAGYKLYKCETNNDVHNFYKYYAVGEQLCTFRDPERINNYYIFFAVKENVDEIKRENFTSPDRQDEYGTSVISLQFDKGRSCSLSIKNRYNHTVINPDATFSNNLENIYPGLTKSFEKYYNIKLNIVSDGFELPNYVMARNGKYYKFNYEINNIYYCPNNIIISRSEPIKYDKNRYEIIDYFIIDKKLKTIKNFDENVTDSFCEYNGEIEKLEITKPSNDGNRLFKIIQTNGNEIFITVNKNSCMVKYENNNLLTVKDNFLEECLYLNEFISKNLQIVGHRCLMNCNMQNIDCANLRKVGKFFLREASRLETINLPSLEYAGSSFLELATSLKEVNFPNLKGLENRVMSHCRSLELINLPNLKYAGDYFLNNCRNLKELNLPKLTIVNDSCFKNCKELTIVNLPEATEIGDYVFEQNLHIKSINLPNVENIGMYFLYDNECLEEFYAPKVRNIKSYTLYNNKCLKKINFPKLYKVETNVLSNNQILESINFPKLMYIGHEFLFNNSVLKEIYLPNVKQIGDYFMYKNKILAKIDMPNLESVGGYFLYYNYNLSSINLPQLKCIGYDFLCKNKNFDRKNIVLVAEGRTGIVENYQKIKDKKNLSENLVIKNDEVMQNYQ